LVGPLCPLHPSSDGSGGVTAVLTHQAIEDELFVSFNDGYEAALRDIAASTVELSDAWRVVGRKTHEQRIRERLATFERCADEFHRRHGTEPFAGGLRCD
jgi:hypothetical protein